MFQDLREDAGKQIMKKEVLSSQKVFDPGAGFSQIVSVEARRLIFISGQVPQDRNGQTVGKGDFDAQARQAFENLAAQLEAAGATFDHVLKIGYFLTNPDDCAKLRKVRAEYLKHDFPASTLLIVNRLFDPDWLIEIEATAALA